MIAQRNPAVAEMVVQSTSQEKGVWLNSRWPQIGWTGKGSGGDQVGQNFKKGGRPETHTDGELGEWQHCWQCWSSSVTDSHFRKMTMLSGRHSCSKGSLTFPLREECGSSSRGLSHMP